MFNKIQLIFLTFICFLVLSSCQKTEFLDDVVFDNSLLNNMSFNAGKKEIKVTFETTFNEPFIDHVMATSPTTRVISWLENNVNNFGIMNKIVIDIQKASIIRKEVDREIKVASIIKKQNEYIYELNFEVSFLLYNDSDQIVATTKTEIFRSTTSSKFISLNERDQILDNLTLDSLRDLSKKSTELLKIHMFEYML